LEAQGGLDPSLVLTTKTDDELFERIHQTNKAWLTGWDAALVEQNPYKRRSQHRAWEAGRIAGQRSNADDVAQMKRRAGYDKGDQHG